MAFSISLCFNGNCREAITYYAKVFNQELPVFLTYEEMDTSFDSNVQVSEAGQQQIANVKLNILGTLINFSDMPDNFEFVQGNNLALCIVCNNFEEANEIYLKLSKDGLVFVPLQKENPSYSLFADKFNVTWNVSVA